MKLRYMMKTLTAVATFSLGFAHSTQAKDAVEVTAGTFFAGCPKVPLVEVNTTVKEGIVFVDECTVTIAAGVRLTLDDVTVTGPATGTSTVIDFSLTISGEDRSHVRIRDSELLTALPGTGSEFITVEVGSDGRIEIEDSFLCASDEFFVAAGIEGKVEVEESRLCSITAEVDIRSGADGETEVKDSFFAGRGAFISSEGETEVKRNDFTQASDPRISGNDKCRSRANTPKVPCRSIPAFQ